MRCGDAKVRYHVAAWAVGLAVVFAIAGLGLSGQANAQPRCVFLECGPGDQPNPSPAQAPRIMPSNPAPAPTPQVRHARAPNSGICHAAGGYNYCVSSVLAPQYGNSYGPRNLVDEDLRTAWVEGVGGQGVGEYIVVELGGVRRVTAIQLMNGYHKNKRIFSINSRVRSGILRFSNGRTIRVRLEDAPGVQTLSFAPIETAWVQFEISEVYAGTKYKDTAITEFRVVTD